MKSNTLQMAYEELFLTELNQMGYELTDFISCGDFGVIYKALPVDKKFLPRRIQKEIDYDHVQTVAIVLLANLMALQ